MQKAKGFISLIQEKQGLKVYQSLNWSGSFEEYFDIVLENPNVARTSYQRIFDMIMSYGTETIYENKEKLTKYNFFSDPMENGKDAIFGLEMPLQKIVQFFKAGSRRYGTEKRVLLLHGPVGSSKSTIARLLKKGLEAYSKKDEGSLYTYSWKETDKEGDDNWKTCPMHEEPLKLIPIELRPEMEKKINANGKTQHEIKIEGSLCPYCRFMFNKLLEENQGDWTAILKNIKVKRLILSEEDRIGIGTFQPKDEKNQDSTELTGDINYRKIAEFGSESDPRAFNFDGEFNVANRGIIEFVEVLKLEVAFLYDLLGASQEHKIKPKKFPQTDIDEVIIGHTNEAEYKKLQNNEFMEALRDRTIKIDIPYITKLDDEMKIYSKNYNQEKIRNKHIAPHTIEIAAMWSVLTRLELPKKATLSLMQKLKLYNGKTLPGYTEETVKELKLEALREGMTGISPRYIQDKISNALVSELETTSINPFMVMNELETGLLHHSLISNDEQKKYYKELLSVVKEEYEDIVKNEVQRAISADEEGIKKLCANYIDNLKAYTQHEKVKNKYTGQYEGPDERLMRSIEEKIGITEGRKDDFRREIMNYIGALAIEGKIFDYSTNERLHKALELKLFEDQKDSIKLTSLISNVVDRETQEKIDVVKARLIKYFGYSDESATDVLNYVASIFARGDVRKNE
ncbi:serine protein kinase [bacterium]|nr:serine protein kinase [bacterium]